MIQVCVDGYMRWLQHLYIVSCQKEVGPTLTRKERGLAGLTAAEGAGAMAGAVFAAGAAGARSGAGIGPSSTAPCRCHSQLKILGASCPSRGAGLAGSKSYPLI